MTFENKDDTKAAISAREQASTALSFRHSTPPNSVSHY